MELVVNADDFGMSYTKNIAIDEMMRKKICTNASVVVNMPSTYEAIELAKKNGYEDKLTLHLNLTIGKSLTRAIRKIDLYYDNDRFVYRPIIKIDKQVYPLYIDEISEEIEAQIKKFLGFGLRLKSIDSHNWVHLRLPVWIALSSILRKYEIKIIRPMWSGYKRPEIASEKWCRYFRNMEPILLKCLECKVIEHTSNIEQFLVDEKELQKCKYVEVFTHPDIVDGKLMDLSSSYIGRKQQQVVDNVALLEKYKKISIKDIF